MGANHIGHASTTLALGLAVGLFAAGSMGVPADSGAVLPPPLPPPAARAWQTGAWAPDRLQHASLGYSLGLAMGIVSGEPAAASGVAVLALAKEIADSRRGRFDRIDLIAGLVGGALGALTFAALD